MDKTEEADNFINKKEDSEKASGSGKEDIVVQNRFLRSTFSLILIIALALVAIGIIAPQYLSALINIFLVLFTGFFILFMILGIAVLVGAKKRVSEVLSGLFEGSLKIIDFVELLKTLIDELVLLAGEIILFCVPIFTVVLSFSLYYLLLIIFRVGGKYVNAGILIITLTFFAVSLLNALNTGPVKGEKKTFSERFKNKFRRYFVDYVEITIAIFFLTMDISNHFMLPREYWGEIKAQFFNVDLMARGFSTQHGIRVGLSLAGAALFTETLRRIYKILMTASRIYKSRKENAQELSRFALMKGALRSGFSENLDDLIKYFGYNTILLLVFMFLPRLKLLSMITFSLTNLIWDIALPKRIFIDKESEDLLSRMIVKTFKL